ncbi:MAG: hypothetical protein IPJ06_00410 [Saprospiraceae bacterium]|nr:hypothetical protein [Saprospiraceae bacterium]
MKRFGKYATLIFGVMMHVLGMQAQSTCTIDVCNKDECGPVQVAFSPSGNNVICEGGVIQLKNTSSTLDFQRFIIDWGDGQIDTVNNYNDISHVYNYAGLDRCEKGPTFNQFYCFIGEKVCDNGTKKSCSWQSNVLSVKLKPVAKFTYSTEICVDKQLLSQMQAAMKPLPLGIWRWYTRQWPTAHMYSLPKLYCKAYGIQFLRAGSSIKND